MCGIFGIFQFDGELVSAEMLSRMGDLMIHRGPDDEGYLIRGSVGIGMRRLSIIDLAGGHQPISNENGDIHIVLNGEIYNYLELRAELIERGHHFSTNSDVEVVVHLYEEMGQACLEKLNGMFTFALYDERLGQLWLARDRLGIKPLFYRRLANGFAFASDLGSLASVGGAELDVESVYSYLGNSYVPEPSTIFRDIYKLECATQMTVKNGDVKTSRYWHPVTKEPWTGSVADATERLEELLLDSADLQLRSDVPVGVFLSGGVDSSAVAAFAARVNSAETVNTFTIDYSGKGGQDASYASKVSNHIGSKHECISVGVDEHLTALEELINKVDEPMSDSAIVPTYILSREARKRGMKVLLSGAGGDEIFGGYTRHFPCRVGSAAWIAHHPWARTPFRLATASSHPHWNRRFINPARNFSVMVSGANLEFLHQALRDQRGYNAMLEKIDCDFAGASSRLELERMQLDLNNYLPNNVLSLTDKATMAASVEGRVPLLDHRLVEFAYSLPSEINLHKGVEKGLFKRVLKSYLPKSVLTRSKEGFNAPMGEWSAKIAAEVNDEMQSLHPLLAQIINTEVVERWCSDTRKRQFASESLYAIFMLSRWLRAHC